MYLKFTKEEFELFLKRSKEHNVKTVIDRLELKKRICLTMGKDNIIKSFVKKYSEYKNISLVDSFIIIENSGIIDTFKATGIEECDCDYNYWFSQLDNIKKGDVE